MTSDEHAAFFGQPIAPRGDGTSTQPNAAAASRGGVSSDLSTKIVLTGMTGGNDPHTPAVNWGENRSPPLIQGQVPGPDEDPFRASLIKKMDSLVKDFRKEKTLRMEILYQILHNGNLDEPDRKATLEQYTLYTDIIAAQQRKAERQGF